VAGADANPYLGIAAVLASGLYGIENNLGLPSPVKGNAYDAQHPDEAKLPATLWDAAQGLKGSKAARQYFGDEFVEHYAATREWGTLRSMMQCPLIPTLWFLQISAHTTLGSAGRYVFLRCHRNGLGGKKTRKRYEFAPHNIPRP